MQAELALVLAKISEKLAKLLLQAGWALLTIPPPRSFWGTLLPIFSAVLFR